MQKSVSERKFKGLRKSELISRLENQEGLLLEREAFIDNLIIRASDLETEVLAKENYSQSLSSEIHAQTEHIKSLNSAISQRDEHVAHLDQRHAQTLTVIEKNETTATLIQDLVDRLDSALDKHELIESKLIDHAEKNRVLAQKFIEKENQFTKLLADKEKQIDSLNADISNTSQMIAKTNSLLMKVDLAKFQAYSESNAEQAREISELKNDIEYRDLWGQSTEARLQEIVAEVSRIRSSISWRATAPLRHTAHLFKALLKLIVKTVKLPYKVLTKIGWKIAPKLFHKIYHHPFTQKFRGSNKPTDQSPVAAAPISPARKTGDVELGSNTEIKVQPIVWTLGERINGAAR